MLVMIEESLHANSMRDHNNGLLGFRQLLVSLEAATKSLIDLKHAFLVIDADNKVTFLKLVDLSFNELDLNRCITKPVFGIYVFHILVFLRSHQILIYFKVG